MTRPRCPGATITLNAGNVGASYLWSNSATTQSINVTASGTYDVRVTNSFKCVGRDTINILPGANPVVFLGNDTTLCPGVTLTLNAGNLGSTYLWSPNTGAVTTQTYGANAPGTYYVRVTNAQKCVGRDTIVITGTTGPIVNLGNDTTLCPGATIVLNAGNPGATYLYNTGATTQTLAVTTAGTYSVRVTTGGGLCVGRDTIRIFAGVNPVVNLGPDTTICKHISSLILNAGNPGNTYAWSTGQNSQTIDIAPFVNATGVPGSFVSVYVVVTNATKCQASDAKVLNLVPVASVNTINKIQSGLGSQFSSDAVNANYYRWDFGDGVSSNDSTPIHYYPSSGTYNVRLIVGNICYYDTAYITLNISNVGTGTVHGNGTALRVYPNPSNGQVIVQYEGAGGMQSMRVLNTVGAVVFEKEMKQTGKEMIDLGGLAAGNYLIQVKTAEGMQVQRIQLTK
jgi:PKD repeat protein